MRTQKIRTDCVQTKSEKFFWFFVGISSFHVFKRGAFLFLIKDIQARIEAKRKQVERWVFSATATQSYDPTYFAALVNAYWSGNCP